MARNRTIAGEMCYVLSFAIILLALRGCSPSPSAETSVASADSTVAPFDIEHDLVLSSKPESPMVRAGERIVIATNVVNVWSQPVFIVEGSAASCSFAEYVFRNNGSRPGWQLATSFYADVLTEYQPPRELKPGEVCTLSTAVQSIGVGEVAEVTITLRAGPSESASHSRKSTVLVLIQPRLREGVMDQRN